MLSLELRCNNPDLAGDVGRIRDLAKVSYIMKTASMFANKNVELLVYRNCWTCCMMNP